jgi:hypothetical protein
MSAVFEPMSVDQRVRFRAAYLGYLRARDGVPNLAARRFDVRERFFAAIDQQPRAWVGAPPVVAEVFHRNHALRRPEPGLDEATLWALATAKTNRAERFGVELSIESGRRPADVQDDPHTFIQIEEFYHTRILRDALATIGLDVEVAEPNAKTKLMVQLMVYLPEAMANVGVLAGEIVGVAIFSLLLEKARGLFAAQPEALGRIEELFAQILVDEVGHVHYVRSQLSGVQLRAARGLIPVVVASLLDDIPELGLLFGKEALLRQALAAEVDAAAAPYPDHFVLPAA